MTVYCPRCGAISGNDDELWPKSCLWLRCKRSVCRFTWRDHLEVQRLRYLLPRLLRYPMTAIPYEPGWTMKARALQDAARELEARRGR